MTKSTRTITMLFLALLAWTQHTMADNGTITWTVGNEQSATLADNIATGIASTTGTVGSDLTATEATYFDTPMIKYRPGTSNAGNVEGVMIEYRVKAAKGYTFKPTNVTYTAVKVGTDNATFSYGYALDGVASSITDVDASTVLRNNGTNTSLLEHSVVINSEEIEVFALRFYISKTANNKDICIGNVIITGEVNAKEAADFDGAEGTITWTKGNEEKATVPTDIASAIGSTTVSVGNDLTVTPDVTYFETTMVKYRPGTTNAGNVEGVMIEYRVKAAKGIKFQPTNVTYSAVKVGTDGATFSYGHTIDGKASSITDVDASTVLRNNGTNTSLLEHSVDINGTKCEEFTFRFYISKTANNKDICIGNVRITGKVYGSVAEVETFALNAIAAPAEGGSITVYPREDSYEAGEEVTLTATENFGYNFVNWTDGEGNVLSTDAKFTYTVSGAADLTANFQAVNTYELAVTVDGANDYMVTLDPKPTIVDGKNMYEEGTYVMITANQYAGLVTFNNWSDGQTASEISVKMSSDISLGANYSQADIIAGWDFYTPGNSGRVADFASADNETAAFSLVSETDGSGSSWLDKSTIAGGGYESMAGAAVNWRAGSSNGDVGHYYWQTKVNAEAFTDINVQFDMLYNYNSYTVYNVDFSTDGENWTNSGSITLTGAKALCKYSQALPEEANNQPNLYIRMAPDKTSEIKGTSSANDGNAIAMVFITGTEQLQDDGTAPVLVATVPAEGANNASANGKVVLTFDEKVALANGATATLGGQTLTPTANGKTVTMEYTGLEYSTEYTFTLPANSVADLTGNFIDEDITIHFTTKEMPEVQKGLYDQYVTNTDELVAAINAANSRSDKNTRYRIFIYNGTYSLPLSTTATINSDDGNSYASPITNITAANISFIGESTDGVVISNDVPNTTYAGTYGTTSVYDGIGKSDVLQLQKNATDTYFQDLTIKSGIEDARGRNIAVQDKATRTIYKNTVLYGYQDTWTSNNDNGLYYFENGTVRGRTDFLCGKGDAYFNAVDIQVCMNTGGYIAVPSKSINYGFVFKDCTIKGESSQLNGKYTLGRPWGQGTPIALWIDTRMEIIPTALGWSEMSNGWPKRFAEYNSTNAKGQTVDLSGRKTKFNNDQYTNNPVLTAAEAAEAADMTNMFGEWEPATLTEQASAPANVVLTGNTLSWDNSNYIFCWAIVKNGRVVDFTTEPTYTVDDETANYAVRAANMMGGLGEAAKASIAEPEGFVLSISDKAGDGTSYYATVSNLGDGNFIVPEGLTLATITVNNAGKIERTNEAKTGDIVTGTNAYFVVSAEAGEFNFAPTTEEATFQPGVSMLYPAIAGQPTTAPDEGNYRFYKLTLNADSEPGTVGFYWGAENGAPFTFASNNKAYLAVPQDTYAGANISITDITGINNAVTDSQNDDAVYTLSGIRVDSNARLPKGIYITKGKKIVNK